MTDAPLPRKVYRIAWTDGKPVCVVAELVAINRSWWHIRHKDGSITKHNGGGFTGPGSFMLRWHLTWKDAWAAEANRLFVSACCDAADLRPTGPTRELHGVVCYAMIDEAMEMGKLLGAIERKEVLP